VAWLDGSLVTFLFDRQLVGQRPVGLRPAVGEQRAARRLRFRGWRDRGEARVAPQALGTRPFRRGPLRLADLIAAELEELLQSNLEEFDRMQHIVNDMLFLARADQGMIVENLVPVPIRSLATKTTEIFEAMIEDAGAELCIVGDASAMADPSLLGRVLANLVDNAIRHGIRPTRIEINIRQDEHKAYISVANPAAPEVASHLDRMFDRFYRADPARHRSGPKGHGLGLAIAKAIVLMHAGSVSARYESGLATIELALFRRGPSGHAVGSSDKRGPIVRLAEMTPL